MVADELDAFDLEFRMHMHAHVSAQALYAS